jgi:excisionase family DNA binding protein
MASALDRIIDQMDGDEFLSTGDVAKLLGVSRQHIVDLCDRGELPFEMAGTHRRIRRSDAEAARLGDLRMTRDQRRSLWLAYAVAASIVERPAIVIDAARRRAKELNAGSRANRWTREWEAVLGRSVETVLDALTSTSLRSRELRQNTPFVLPDRDRDRVLEAFNANGRP